MTAHFESMTYREIAAFLGCKIDSAKKLATRRQWKRIPANKGKEILVHVPLEWLQDIKDKELPPAPDSTADSAVDNTADNTADSLRDELNNRIGSLQAEARFKDEKILELTDKVVQYENDKKTVSDENQSLKIDMAVTVEKLKAAEAALSDYRSRSLLKRIFG